MNPIPHTKQNSHQTSRENIQAIYPLMAEQQVYLLADQVSGDQSGLLHVRCRLSGELDLPAFQKAWDATRQRHEILRASIHSRADKSPMMVVWRHLDSDVAVTDLAEESHDERRLVIQQYLEADRQHGLPLDNPPIGRVHLFRVENQQHELIWTIHHAMLDGWSTALVLQDWLAAYQAILGEGSSSNTGAAPCYQDYINWRTNHDRFDEEAWRSHLDGYRGVPEFHSRRAVANYGATPLKQIEARLEGQVVKRLASLIQDQRITAGSVASASWALTLAKLFDQEDVAFGVAVSGRIAPIDGMEEMAGPFSNVVPFRVRVTEDQTLVAWLQSLRDLQFDMQPYQTSALSDIASCCRLPRDRVLMNTLLVVENFPVNFTAGAVRVDNYRSGIASAYPLTICVLPQDSWTVRAEYDDQTIDEELAQAIVNRFLDSLQAISKSADRSMRELRNSLGSLPFDRLPGQIVEESDSGSFVEPRTETEIQLVMIWEQVLGKSPIGITDHFFELGGRSLHAVRLLSKVEQAFGHRLSPAVLLEKPTIESLAELLEQNAPVTSSTLIRFNRLEQGSPVVCVHAGGGQAMYFRFFAGYLSEIPVIGLQQKGLEDGRPLKSIEDIAESYLQELDSTFGGKPYHLVGYCIGATVAFEMARRLERSGRTLGSLTIIDSPIRWAYRRQSVAEFRARNNSLPMAVAKCLYLKARRAYRDLRLRFRLSAENRREIYRVRVERTSVDALFHYRPEIISQPIYMIRSTHYAELPDKEFHTRWRELTTGGFEVDTIDAQHQNIMLEPHVREVAELISARLQSRA